MCTCLACISHVILFVQLTLCTKRTHPNKQKTDKNKNLRWVTKMPIFQFRHTNWQHTQNKPLHVSCSKGWRESDTWNKATFQFLTKSTDIAVGRHVMRWSSWPVRGCPCPTAVGGRGGGCGGPSAGGEARLGWSGVERLCAAAGAPHHFKPCNIGPSWSCHLCQSGPHH